MSSARLRSGTRVCLHATRGRAGTVTTAALAAAGCLIGCSVGVGHRPSSTAAAVNVGPASTGNVGLLVAVGHGWTASGGALGPRPGAGSCRYRHAGHGEQLPDPRCTPGAVDAAVSATTLATTVCRTHGYTAAIRPPLAVTTAAKREVMAAYGVPWSQARRYELDHLIPLSAGGASDLRNLWPELNTTKLYGASAFVHNDKDEVEAVTHDAICARKTSLHAVQVDVAANWTTAIARLRLPPIKRTR